MHITHHSIKLKIDKPERYNCNLAYNLYAILCSCISPEYAEQLHLQGKLRPICQNFTFNHREKTADWNVTLLGEAQKEFEAALSMPSYFIKDRNITLTPIHHCTTDYTTEYLLDKARKNASASEKTNIYFCTPTSFKQNGEYVIFPSVKLILNSLAETWSEFDEVIKLNDADAIKMMADKIKIVNYDLKTSYYRLKAINIPAFVGRITLTARLSPPLMELYSLMIEFANLYGIGIKNALGMGKIKAERIVYDGKK